ncbi:ras-GEF domain-containing family member 1B-B-like [Pseudoliparis swirei]|uniref:ras-GEF domain-containing family member 1B-B-like n=1 Tax=Pseudoliparis swirei TaxID=2059687 RepID=UPI0024BE0214|nr:ras-GEF domain-containing family member 1B-B-like [Pseudoliparis swirei]
MPPTTPYPGKFSSCAPYGNNNNSHPQPHSPYCNGGAPKPAKESAYSGAYSPAENPYDVPQPHGSYRSSSVSSAAAREHHYNSSCAVSENPYSSSQPHSPRQHSTSCPGRAYRHTTTTATSAAAASSSSGGSSEQCSRNNSVAAKSRRHGHGVTASYGEMCYHDNSLVSASLEALIQHLVPTVDYYPDRSYVFTFLLSSRLFLHPYELMTKVCHLCVEQQRSGDALLDKIRFREVAPKLVQLLTEWTETFPYDFRDERMMRCLKDMTQHVARGDEYSWRAMQQMTQRLIKRLSALGQYEEAVSALNAVAMERPASLKSKQASGQRSDMMSVCDDPFVLAQQLTHIELDRLSFIGPEEFIQTFARKDPLENHKGFFRKRKTSNLEAYINWFNRLSYLVATEICMPVKKKHRARIIEFFIDVAQECFNIGNFNSLMAIITGMNMSPVARLRKTWSKVNTDKFEILEHQMDPSSNFSNYRTALRGATQRSETAHSSQEKIVIPFFSLLIKDIYFLNEGCASSLTNGHINFEKLWELAKQVSEFLVWRQVICPFDRDRRILQYLVTTPVFSEDELHLASYESEGPENHMEKDSRRSLRSSLLHRENRS